MAKELNENAGCLSILIPILEKLDIVKDTGKKKKPLPYRVRDDFLSRSELSFYKVLENLLGSRLVIQSKVRLADIFFIIRPNENHRSYFPRISEKHLDFLVCDAKTMQPVFGVELDDSSHNSAKRKKRDAFVDEVFATANLPLLHVPNKRQYNSRELAEQIRPLLKDYIQASAPPAKKPVPQKAVPNTTAVKKSAVTASPTKETHSPKVSTPQTPIKKPPQPKTMQAKKTPVPTFTPDQPEKTDVPLCPKCGIPMVVRTVSKGNHKGKQFYGCSNFPKCRQMKPIENKS